jgi:hypothetical protein
VRTGVGALRTGGAGSGFSTIVESAVSRNCGVGASTALASVRSRESAESAALALSESAPLHAANAMTATMTSNLYRDGRNTFSLELRCVVELTHGGPSPATENSLCHGSYGQLKTPAGS